MKSRYFPICLDIGRRQCVVIGGGNVAERKVKGLLDHGGEVTVISPEITPGLGRLIASGEISLVERGYRPGDLRGAFLVIAATDDPAVQEQIHAEAESGNILLNVADVPKWCNFILPATVRRGDLAVSISTGGASPALARRIRQDLESRFGPEYEVLLSIMAELRPLILAAGQGHAENKVLFERLLHPDMVEWIRQRQWDTIEDYMREVLENVDPSWHEVLKRHGTSGRSDAI